MAREPRPMQSRFFSTQAPAGAPAAASQRQLVWAGGLIGFALGAFLDGILLHQVLQWHHLFSLVPGEAWRDIRNQILMDGWFHVFCYIVACAGLAVLWSARFALAGPGSGRRVLASALLGFSLWQFVDEIGFHWIINIHRTRVGTPYALAYDLGWLALFGLTSLAAGTWLWRRAGSGGGGRRAAVGLAALALVAGPVAARPGAGGATVILFRDGLPAAQTFAAAAAGGAPVLWASPAADVITVAAPPSLAESWRLYRSGALLIGSTPGLGGCLGWARG